MADLIEALRLRARGGDKLLEEAAAALEAARDGFVLVPVEVVEVCWNVIDNLSDPPINDDWARRTADRLIQLLDEGPQEAKP